MGLGITQSFATFERALTLRAHRAELLGNNIANADTPGFKARDIDFADMMRSSPGKDFRPAVALTHAAHIGPRGLEAALEPGYRIPLQPSLDQNTVETEVEQAQFMDNSVRYQATLSLLNGKIRHLITAVTGQ